MERLSQFAVGKATGAGVGTATVGSAVVLGVGAGVGDGEGFIVGGAGEPAQ